MDTVRHCDLKKKKLRKMLDEGFVRFLEPKELLFWVPRGTNEIYPKANTIFYRGHYPHGLHIFTQGTIAIEYVSARKAQQIIIREPAILALNHLCERTTNKYTVITIEPSEFIFVPLNILNKDILEKGAQL